MICCEKCEQGVLVGSIKALCPECFAKLEKGLKLLEEVRPYATKAIGILEDIFDILRVDGELKVNKELMDSISAVLNMKLPKEESCQ